MKIKIKFKKIRTRVLEEFLGPKVTPPPNLGVSKNFYGSASGNYPKSSLPERRAPRNFEQAVSPENFSRLFFGKNFEN